MMKSLECCWAVVVGLMWWWWWWLVEGDPLILSHARNNIFEQRSLSPSRQHSRSFDTISILSLSIYQCNSLILSYILTLSERGSFPQARSPLHAASVPLFLSFPLYLVHLKDKISDVQLSEAQRESCYNNDVDDDEVENIFFCNF